MVQGKSRQLAACCLPAASSTSAADSRALALAGAGHSQLRGSVAACIKSHRDTPPVYLESCWAQQLASMYAASYELLNLHLSASLATPGALFRSCWTCMTDHNAVSQAFLQIEQEVGDPDHGRCSRTV